ncbi:MAG: hypothetical protein HYW93_07665 [Thaumarchaeota archaeon]|nr:hypothetical protein [Nitrososphaerota archaeon]
MSSQAGEPDLDDAPKKLTRKYGLAGVGLFFLGFGLGAVANTLGQLWIVPFADILIVFAIFLAIFGAVKAGTSIRSILVVGIAYGIGFFYKGDDHETHVLSGIGFGLPHEAHIVLGLGIMALSTVIVAALSFRSNIVEVKAVSRAFKSRAGTSAVRATGFKPRRLFSLKEGESRELLVHKVCRSQLNVVKGQPTFCDIFNAYVKPDEIEEVDNSPGPFSG